MPVDLEGLFQPRLAESAEDADVRPRRILRPSLEGQTVEALEPAQPLLDGFASTCRLLLGRRTELLGDSGLLDRFAMDEVRVRLRAAHVYEQLLAGSFRPMLLRNALERDRYLDRRWTAVPAQPGLARAIAHEQADLLRGDIPKFTTRPNSRNLWSASGVSEPEFFAESGLDAARRRVRRMSETSRYSSSG